MYIERTKAERGPQSRCRD